MNQQPRPMQVYGAIIGVSALLCFAFLLTSNVWLTMAIVSLGCLQLLRFHPTAEEYISTDPLLLPICRFTPLIVLAIVAADQYLRAV